MKKLLLTGAMLLGVTCGVFAQGYFNLDNTTPAYLNGFATGSAGNYYTGGGGLEVWEANSATAAQIAAINGAPSGVAAYAALAGWNLEKTFTSSSLFSFGTVGVGAVKMPDVSPAGATVTVALVAWNDPSKASASSMIASPGTLGLLGAYAFSQKTADYTAQPLPIAPDLQWGTPTAQGDLVMTAIPEPGTFALAGLGAAALLIFRRRK